MPARLSRAFGVDWGRPVLDPRQSSFGGQLKEFRLVELVQTMGMSNNSGTLELTHADGRRGAVYFENGALVLCREYDSAALTLGAVLQQLALVDAATIEESYDRQAQEPLGDPLGKRLVESGAITPRQLGEALRTQTLWTVRELSLWDNGEYSFNPVEQAPPRTTTPPIETSQVAMEIIRYQHEWSDLHQFLPYGMHTRLQMAIEAPLEHPLLFTAAQWCMITRVNAYHSPRRIAITLRLPEMEVARVLALLARDGLLYASYTERSVGLPEVSHTIDARSIDLFSLFSRMEQEWKRRRALAEQLSALALFINWTMEALEAAWRANALVLADDSLESLLAREQCRVVAGYKLRITSNHIDVDDFTAYLRQLSRQGAPQDLLAAYDTLVTGLLAVFTAINQRVDSLQDRSYYEDAWKAMFAEFDGSLSKS